MPKLTELRAYRMRHGLTLMAVAFRAGLSVNRASQLERTPTLATPGEIAALREAVDLLCKE